MGKFLIETTRCLLREMTPGDAVGIFKLNLHPDILRFTTDPPFDSVIAAREFLQAYDAYKLYGIGRWAVELKDSGSFIGWCGLKFHPEDQEVDVGYRLLPEYWGSGYAAETGTACINYGFENGLERIVARIHHENLRSVKVAKKMGMTYEKELQYKGITWLNYVKNKPAIQESEI